MLLEILVFCLLAAMSFAVTISIALLQYRRRMMAIRASFPVEVPGWKTRLEEIPFKAKPEDFARMMTIIVKHAVDKKGYSKKKCVAALNLLLVDFVHYDKSVEEETGGKANRHIRSPWGFMAGNLKNNRMVITYRPEDGVENTEFDHECCHQLHEIVEKKFDSDHEDLDMWNDVEQSANKEYRGEG